MTYKLPHCIICDRACIPLADYDQPVCPGCDDDMARAVRVRANFELLPHYANAWSNLPDPTGCGTPAGYLEHVEKDEWPCQRCTHYMDIGLRNAIAWVRARRMAMSRPPTKKRRGRVPPMPDSESLFPLLEREIGAA